MWCTRQGPDGIVLRQVKPWCSNQESEVFRTQEQCTRRRQDARVVHQAQSESRGHRGPCQNCALAREVKSCEIRPQRQINVVSWFAIDVWCARCARLSGCTWRKVLFLLMIIIAYNQYKGQLGGLLGVPEFIFRLHNASLRDGLDQPLVLYYYHELLSEL